MADERKERNLKLHCQWTPGPRDVGSSPPAGRHGWMHGRYSIYACNAPGDGCAKRAPVGVEERAQAVGVVTEAGPAAVAEPCVDAAQQAGTAGRHTAYVMSMQSMANHPIDQCMHMCRTRTRAYGTWWWQQLPRKKTTKLADGAAGRGWPPPRRRGRRSRGRAPLPAGGCAAGTPGRARRGCPYISRRAQEESCCCCTP